MTVTIPAQHVVDGIEQIGPHHTDFVNDQQVDTTHDVDFLLAEAILVSGLSSEMGLGDEGRERQLEKGMDGDASRIHGRHTGGSQYNHTLGRPLTETAQKSRLSTTGLAGQKQIDARILRQLPGQFQFGI